MNLPFISGIRGLRFSIESVFLDARGHTSLLVAHGVDNLSGLHIFIFKVRGRVALKFNYFTYY